MTPRRGLVAALAAATTLIVGACGSPPSISTLPRDSGASPSSIPEASLSVTDSLPPESARLSPRQVCHRFALLYLAADTRTDPSPAAARRRAAARYGTQHLQRLMAAPQPGDPRWPAWSARGVHIETRVRPYAGEHPPAGSATTQYAAAVVERTAVTATGTRSRLATAIVYCTLVRTHGRWRVNEVGLDLDTLGAAR